MAKELVTSVTVHNDDGSYTTYQPGDDVPAEDAKKITNPAAWEDGDEDYGEEDTWTPGSGEPPPTADAPGRSPNKPSEKK